VELLGVVPLAELEVDCCCLNDLDAGGPHTVTGGHLVVHLLHSTIQGGVTVLLVHVVVTCSALVTQPDAVVLDCGRVALKDLVDGENLSVALLHLLELPQEVPELGLGADLVGGPELHSVDLGVLIAGGRQRAAHHLVLMEPVGDHFGKLARPAAAAARGPKT